MTAKRKIFGKFESKSSGDTIIIECYEHLQSVYVTQTEKGRTYNQTYVLYAGNSVMEAKYAFHRIVKSLLYLAK